jgi:hypothetical protein
MKESAELVRQACAGKRPARTPIYDILANDAVIAHFAGRPLDGSDDLGALCLAIGRGLDATRYLLAPSVEGAVRKDRFGNTFMHQRWTSWVSDHVRKELEDWVRWLPGEITRLETAPPVTPAARAAARQEQVDLLQRLNGSVYIACTPSTAINEALFGYHCGLEILSYLWADEPELVLRWFRAIETAQQRFIELTAHADQAALAVIYSDVAFKGRLMFSLDTFRAWGFFDDVARICAACHRAGLQVIFHSDGYIMDLLPDLVAAGIDGLNPIEKAAGMDLYEIRRLYPQLILAGGLDVTHLLPFGTPEEVRRETRRMINETGSEGRLLIGSSTEVGNDVPLANYLAFRDEVFAG